MRNAFALREPLTFKFGSDIGDIRKNGIVRALEQPGFEDVLLRGFPVRIIIGGEMEDAPPASERGKSAP